jgi:hypothetical protein
MACAQPLQVQNCVARVAQAAQAAAPGACDDGRHSRCTLPALLGQQQLYANKALMRRRRCLQRRSLAKKIDESLDYPTPFSVLTSSGLCSYHNILQPLYESWWRRDVNRKTHIANIPNHPEPPRASHYRPRKPRALLRPRAISSVLVSYLYSVGILADNARINNERSQHPVAAARVQLRLLRR